MAWWLILLLWLGGILVVAALSIFGLMASIEAVVRHLDEMEKKYTE